MYRNTGTSMGLFDNLISSPYMANQDMRMRYDHGGTVESTGSTGDGMTDEEYWQGLSDQYKGETRDSRVHPLLLNKRGLVKKYGQEWWDERNPDIDQKIREYDLTEEGKERLLSFERGDFYSENPHVKTDKFGAHTGRGYDPAYEAEEKRREEAAYRRGSTEDWRKDGMTWNEWNEAQGTENFKPRLTDEEWATSKDNPDNLKNPWEKDYTGWYDDDEQFTSGRTGKEQHWYEANERLIERGVTPSQSHIDMAGGTQGVSPDDGKKGTSGSDPGPKMRVTPSGGGGGGQSSAGLFGDYGMPSSRSGGTTGGGAGSEGMGLDLMEENRFMDMNPYITPNVLTFKYGGRMHKPKYDGGGMYTQKANEMIAMNQISNIMGGVNSPYTANQGMKYNYNHGGELDEPQLSSPDPLTNSDWANPFPLYTPEDHSLRPSHMSRRVKIGSSYNPDPYNSGRIDRDVLTRYDEGGEVQGQLGGIVAKLQNQIPNPQDAMNIVSKLTGNQPMANKGMKMRKRYIQGGRF